MDNIDFHSNFTCWLFMSRELNFWIKKEGSWYSFRSRRTFSKPHNSLKLSDFRNVHVSIIYFKHCKNRKIGRKLTENCILKKQFDVHFMIKARVHIKPTGIQNVPGTQCGTYLFWTPAKLSFSVRFLLCNTNWSIFTV